MKLFDLVDNKLEISEEAYTLKPFKALWDRDKSKDKATALGELAFVYFMIDYRSDFVDITEDAERKIEILKNIDLLTNWEEDAVVREAMKFYQEITETFSVRYVKDVKLALEQIRKYLRNLDLEAVDKMGKPKFDIAKTSRLIEGSDAMLENLSKLETRVKRDMEQKLSVRGGKTKTIFEDGI